MAAPTRRWWPSCARPSTSPTRGLPQPSGTETVESFLASWLESSRRRLRPSTWEDYERHLRLHVLPTLGRRRLAKLLLLDLDRLYQQLLAAGLSPTTVHHVQAILHKARDQAMRWDLVGRNVASLVDPPRVAQTSMRALTPEEARHFLPGGRASHATTLASGRGAGTGKMRDAPARPRPRPQVAAELRVAAGRGLARVAEADVPGAASHQDRLARRAENRLDQRRLARARGTADMDKSALDHRPTSGPRILVTKPPAPSSLRSRRRRSRTSPVLPVRSAAAMACWYAANTSAPVTSYP